MAYRSEHFLTKDITMEHLSSKTEELKCLGTLGLGVCLGSFPELAQIMDDLMSRRAALKEMLFPFPRQLCSEFGLI